jgi:hypothetical protein
LQISARKKQNEYDRMRHNFTLIEDKLKNYEAKFLNIISLYESAIEKVSEEVENNNFKIDLMSLKKCNFENLNNEEKYAVMILLMKQLIPLLGEKDLKNYQDAFENVKVINKKNNKSNISVEDPFFKKLFGPNLLNLKTYQNNINSINLETLPLINTKRSISTFDSKGKSNRVIF